MQANLEADQTLSFRAAAKFGDGNAEFLFELADAARQLGLGDMTGLSGAGKMFFTRRGVTPQLQNKIPVLGK